MFNFIFETGSPHVLLDILKLQVPGLLPVSSNSYICLMEFLKFEAGTSHSKHTLKHHYVKKDYMYIHIYCENIKSNNKVRIVPSVRRAHRPTEQGLQALYLCTVETRGQWWRLPQLPSCLSGPLRVYDKISTVTCLHQIYQKAVFYFQNMTIFFNIDDCSKTN